MKQIKTIKYQLDAAENFDNAVNEALKEGWKLKKREILPPYEGPTRFCHRMLYAELEKDSNGDEVERDCTNCKHSGKAYVEEPCRNCKEGEKWEAAE